MPRPPAPADLPASDDASRTRVMPRSTIALSSKLDIDVIDTDGLDRTDGIDLDDFAEKTTPSLVRPQIVVLQERLASPDPLVDGMVACGFHVRPASTGLEVMTLTTQHQIVAVVVGPGDAERRRVLTASIRQRHPGVAVVHVLKHLDDNARRTAAAAGASVLPWPLPSVEDVLAVVPMTMQSPSSVSVPFAEPTGELPLLSADASAVSSDELPTHIVSAARSPSALASRSPSSVFSARLVDDHDDGGDDDLVTMPRLREPKVEAAAHIDDIAAALSAVPAVVAELVETAAFLESAPVKGSAARARALHQAARLLTTLHAHLERDR